MSLPSAETLGWGTLASFWWAAEYLGLDSKTMRLESWKPGVWREVWAAGRQLGVGGVGQEVGAGEAGSG